MKDTYYSKVNEQLIEKYNSWFIQALKKKQMTEKIAILH